MSRKDYVTGLRAVEELLATGAGSVKKLYSEYRTVNPRVSDLVERARASGVEVQSANRARLRQMSGDARHQGVVAQVERSSRLDEAGLRSLVESRMTAGGGPLLLLLLDSVQDPHNLGACLRSADGAGVDAVVVPRHGAADLSPAVSKVAAGAAEQLPFARVGNLVKVLDWLRDYGVHVVGTSDQAPRDLYEASLSGHLALVMGGEHAGLRDRLADRCHELVRLPMAGQVSSLNVSVAAGVCLYEAVRQRRSAGEAPPDGG